MPNKTVIYDLDLSEKRVNMLSNPDLKDGLLTYLNGINAVSSGRWAMAKGFRKAYENMSKETRLNEDGQQVKRFETSGKFYKFVGIKDANASQLLNACYLNDSFTADGHSLEEYGFSIGKVYALHARFKDGQDSAGHPTYNTSAILDFFEYALNKLLLKENIADIAKLSDKGLLNAIKTYDESIKATEQATEQAAEQATEQATEQTTEQATEQTDVTTLEISRDNMLAFARAYTHDYDVDLISDLVADLIAGKGDNPIYTLCDIVKPLMNKYGIKQIRQ